MTENERQTIDRCEGALIGVAVGDALGAPLEFMSAGEIRRRFGVVREMIGGGWLSVVPGEVTDDTQMTLAVAEGIALGKPEALVSIGQNFLTWYATHPKDVGGTCAAVLDEMRRRAPSSAADWHAAAKSLYERTGGMTAGNGALMRTVYPALWYADADEAIKMAVEIGRMTHWHPESDEVLRIYTKAIHEIVHSGMSADEARKWIKNLMPAQGEPRPTGYCRDSLRCAFLSAQRTDTFEAALVDAVNRGGDADTIGAIAGGLAGAVYGAKAIPQRWLHALDNEPNRRTVELFHADPKAPENNTLLIRLIILAQAACRH